MKLRASLYFLLPFAALSIGAPARAAVECEEQVTYLIMHSNGFVYFVTDKTCTNGWCQIAWSTSDANNKAYAMLLAAKTSGKKVVFHWPNLSNCTTANSVYAVPALMYLPPE